MAQDGRHPLRGLLVAQFLGAFNDNAWKLFVAFLAIRAATAGTGAAGAALEALSQRRTTLVFVVFTLPLVLFSLPAAVLADRISKRTLIVVLKGAELVLMASGGLVLWLAPGSVALPLAVLALMGAHSALFSPAKYGILPELLPHERLSRGNALIETTTMIAIILGSAAGGVLRDLSGERLWITGAILAGLAAAGFAASLAVPRVAPAGAGGRVGETVRTAWGAIRGERVLWLTTLGLTFFWGMASLLGQDILVYAKSVLGLSDT